MIGMKTPNNNPANTKPRRRVAILRSRVHHLGTVEAMDEKVAEAEAAKVFALIEEERARQMVWEHD